MRTIVAIALFAALPVFAQPAGKLSGTPAEKAAQKAKITKYHNDRAACEAQARKPQTVNHPAKVTPYPVAYKRCMELRSVK